MNFHDQPLIGVSFHHQGLFEALARALLFGYPMQTRLVAAPANTVSMQYLVGATCNVAPPRSIELTLVI